MAIVQNIGKPVPGKGKAVRDETKSGMNLKNYKIPGPSTPGSGSGILGGGTLSKPTR